VSTEDVLLRGLESGILWQGSQAAWRPDLWAPQCQRDQIQPSYTIYTRHVYTQCMGRVRTNIEIEDTFLRIVMNRYGVHTKTEAVDLALRHLAGLPMTRDEALAMRGAGAIGEIPADAGPSEW
jgi:Arc/MetJ family transcription regulator